MNRSGCRMLVAALLAGAVAGVSAQTPAPAEVTLTRLDCGSSPGPSDVGRFSDVFAMRGLMIPIVYSCYLVRHGEQALVWDTGHAPTAGALAPRVNLVDQLAQLGLKPEQVAFVGISHYHPDHTGQVGSLPQATLLIGRGDWDVISSAQPPPSAPPGPFRHWLAGAGKVEPLAGDKDVFGDGRVVVLATPGHTPGHRSLLVRLAQAGAVLITGDLAHFRENYDTLGVPPFNTGRADTLASLDRFKKIAANLGATVIIQHDGRDVAKLPAFPAAAR